jgi:TM2 domain-containing membrane protein YozV
MYNYTNDNTARRYTAHISSLGTTQIHLRSPYIIAWWSAAFPGFGHLLLSKYIRGFLLFTWEFVVNLNAHVNLAILYSFQGDIDAVISVLDTKWFLVYTPVYFFGIWDSYRTTVDLNKIYILAEREEHRFNSFSIGTLEVNYLDKRNPWMAIVWSLFAPGLGQLYIHRVLTAFVGVGATIGVFYFSNFLEAVTLFLSGEVHQATLLLNPEWLLFLPSIYGFSIYDSYMNTVENNKLFEKEQRRFLKDNYQNPDFRILKGKRVK